MRRIWCKNCKWETQHVKESDTSTMEKVFLFPVIPLVLALENKWYRCLVCDKKTKI